KKKKKKKKSKMGVHPMLEKRKLEGGHWTLFKDLLKYDDKFDQYFRMPRCKLHDLLKLIEPVLQKQNASSREAISPAEQ
ncbi:hypothetical protein EAI_02079, partial [Harpegnathos saltator]